MGHAVSGLGGCLAARDGEGQEGVVIAADELGHGIDCFLALVAVQKEREQFAQEQERAGSAAGMDFIAHEDALGNDLEDVDAFLLGTHGAAENGAEHVAHPAQALDGALIVGAHPDNVALAFVEGGPAAGAELTVFHNQDGHGGRDHAAHGAGGAECVVVGELDITALELGFQAGLVGAPSLEDGSGFHGTLLGIAHTFEFDFRSGMQDVVGLHAGNNLDGGLHIHPQRTAGLHAAHGFLIGFVDFRGRQSAEDIDEFLLAECRRTPVNLDGFDVLTLQFIVKFLKADIDEGHVLTDTSHS